MFRTNFPPLGATDIPSATFAGAGALSLTVPAKATCAICASVGVGTEYCTRPEVSIVGAGFSTFTFPVFSPAWFVPVGYCAIVNGFPKSTRPKNRVQFFGTVAFIGV